MIFNSIENFGCQNIASTMLQFLNAEHALIFGSNLFYNRDKIDIVHMVVPQQQNSVDCGLYLLQYAETFFKVKTIDLMITNNI